MESSPGLSQANFRATHSLTISGMGFASLRGLAKEAERLGLFKAASFSIVLASLVGLIDTQIDTQSLPSVSEVDIFISHSWSSSNWLKMLAICHHLNLDFAIASSIVTWMVALLVMLLRAGSYVALLEESFTVLVLTTVVLPVTFLLLTYFGGDAVRTTRLWFDKACVSTATPFSKLHTLQMIPAIVASSGELVVVWDESGLLPLSLEGSSNASWPLRMKNCTRASNGVPYTVPKSTLQNALTRLTIGKRFEYGAD